MFGGGSVAVKIDPSTTQDSQATTAVIELSDSEPELTTHPSTPTGTGPSNSNAVSAESSLGVIDGGEGALVCC